ncbi:hypothetical protein [Ralstonia solanacearum]|uniref:hypothetical protein n=1 Tax=Ralstonia solanacearum TaxID=305 RepID=UPI0012DAD58A|nr:hypothetical protein [Ralstonia solanacearum]
MTTLTSEEGIPASEHSHGHSYAPSPDVSSPPYFNRNWLHDTQTISKSTRKKYDIPEIREPAPEQFSISPRSYFSFLKKLIIDNTIDLSHTSKFAENYDWWIGTFVITYESSAISMKIYSFRRWKLITYTLLMTNPAPQARTSPIIHRSCA